MRKIIKKLHLYFALVLCIPLVLQGLAGATMVFQREVSDSQLRSNHHFTEGTHRNVSEIIAAAKTAVPDDFSATLVQIPFEEKSPAAVRFTKKAKERKSMLEVAVDPVSLVVVRVKNPATDFFSLVKKFHTSLFIPGPIGKNIVGAYGLVLLFMAISGLIIWWPKPNMWRMAFTFKLNSKGRQFYRGSHGAVGFWSLLPLMIVSFAGVYLAYTPATTSFILAIFPGQDLKASASKIRVQPQEKQLNIDEVINVGKSAAATDEKLLSINLPAKPDQPYRINFAPQNYRDGKPLITVFVDQYQQKVIEKRDPALYSIGEKIIAWQHALHTGEGTWYVWKFMVFLIGFSPLFFSITGIALWWIKKKSKRKAVAI